MKLAPKILAPIFGLAAVLVGTICLSLWLQERVALLDNRESQAKALMLEASELRSLSRAVQRDAVKLASETWASARPGLTASIETRMKALTGQAQKVAELSKASSVDVRDLMPLVETFSKELESVRRVALSGESARATNLFVTLVEPAEKNASRLTDALIEGLEQQIVSLEAEAERFHRAASLILVIVAGLALMVALGVAVPSFWAGSFARYTSWRAAPRCWQAATWEWSSRDCRGRTRSAGLRARSIGSGTM